jgi:hypothetical protein
MTEVFLTSTSAAIQSYSVPSDWADSGATIEAQGPGGNGSARQSSTRAGIGGGGGSYAIKTTPGLTASTDIYYLLPAGGSGLDAWFNDLNLCLQTNNQIGGTSWTRTACTATQSQAGPGSVGNVASLLTESATTDFHGTYQSSTMSKPASTAITLTYTIYAKASGSRNVGISLYDGAFSSGAYVWVDIGGLSVNTSATYGSGWTITSSAVTDAGSGWVKIVFVVSVNNAATSFGASIDILNAAFADNYAGNGTSGLVMYGANVTYGIVDKGFTPTTTTALYSVLAKAGTNATTSAAGVGQSGSQGDTTYQGGNGNRPAASVTTGGGGGGAAGPSGAGGNASTSTGGSANNGTTAGATAGNAGNAGTEYDGTHGAGSGAGGRSGNGTGFAGGAYGGAGSGAGTQSGQAGGAGSQSLIIINYTAGGVVALQGTNAIAFANTGLLGLARPLAGTNTVAFTNVGKLGLARPLAASNTVAFTNTGTLRQIRPLSGSNAIAFSNTGLLGLRRPLSTTNTVTFTSTGTINVAIGLAGTNAVAFSNTGLLGLARPLSGANAVSFSNTGRLDLTLGLSGDNAVAFANAGTLTQIRPLAGQNAVTIANTGTLGLARPLSGSSTVTFSNTGVLSIEGQVDLAGENAIVLTSTGALRLAQALAGTNAVSFNNTGDLSIIPPPGGGARVQVVLM